MTTQFNQERYQSDRLTFERQQFEDAYRETYSFKHFDDFWFFRKDDNGNYVNVTELNYLWDGWKLAKGIKE